MRRQTIMTLLGGVSLVTACASDPAPQVRAIGPASIASTDGDQAALGRSALALGNVGIAIQYFRHLLRLRPNSTEALSGIASCYEAMGRADLSRRYYQEALALAPTDVKLLGLYASSLARQGAVTEAQSVIAEIARRTEAPAAQWIVEPAAVPAFAPPVDTASGAGTTPTAEAPEVAADVARTTTVAAPPVAPPVTAIERGNSAPRLKARLERLSLGEIALVTNGAPLWVALPRARAAPKLAARPLLAAPHMVRLLNAARRRGLAAARAEQLQGAGWRSVAIGNAARIRSASLILYPAGQRGAARKLAADLNIGTIRLAMRRDILVLLGRDSG